MQKGKKIGIAFGRAESFADCTAEQAAAWFFEVCSRERMEIDKKEGNPGRLETRSREKILNGKLTAGVKKDAISSKQEKVCRTNAFAVKPVVYWLKRVRQLFHRMF